MQLVKLQWLHPSIRPNKSEDEYWDALIHAEDLATAHQNEFSSSIFMVERIEGAYVIIKQMQINLRVKPSELQPIKYEGLYLGDKVRVVPKAGINSEKEGLIKQMAFHHKLERLFYHLEDAKGKEISKRYFSHDLEKLNQ